MLPSPPLVPTSSARRTRLPFLSSIPFLVRIPYAVAFHTRLRMGWFASQNGCGCCIGTPLVEVVCPSRLVAHLRKVGYIVLVPGSPSPSVRPSADDRPLTMPS